MVSKAIGLQVFRSILMAVMTGLYFAALQVLPLADTAAVMYVAPLIVTMLSVPLLGESVGPRRWASVCVGFLGVLIIIRPGAGVMQFAALLPLGAAVLHAFYQITTRKVSAVDAPLTSLVYTALVGAIVTTVWMPMVWQTPDVRGWGLMILMGLRGGGGHFALIKAFQAAPASTATPFGYTNLIWVTAYGFILFGALPDNWTIAGATIVVMSGLYIFRREQARKEAPSEI
jgi:drug/metabolite transporter (DMT)-like permease